VVTVWVVTARFEVPNGLPSQAQQSGEQRIVVLGDSVATGAGCDCSPFGPRLARLLARGGHRRVVATTLAQNGQATRDVLIQLRYDEVTRHAIRQASVVTLTVSANDFDADKADGGCPVGASAASCYDGDLRDLPEQLDSVLATVRSLAGPETKVLVTGYWNVFLDGAVGARQGGAYQQVSSALTDRVDEQLRLAATRAGAQFVDLHAAFHRGGSADDTSLLAADGDHPSAAGHERIAAALAEALATH